MCLSLLTFTLNPEVTSKIGLIDYGMGNLHSVQKAFERLKQAVKIINLPSDINDVGALVLPGVGSFDPAMQELKKTNFIPFIKSWVNEGKPLLGICLGLQLFFESSEEGNEPGLGLLKGHVRKLPIEQSERIPHMGWAPLKEVKGCPLLENSQKTNWVYFVHSYSAIPSEKEDLAATASFGESSVTAIVWQGNIGACQFHPEKSSKTGHDILQRWVNWLKTTNKI